MVPLCLILSQLSRHHLDLHSFPTRRSSDLTARARPCLSPSRNHCGRHSARTPRRKSQANFVADRKSTRLNSSHVAISYAVLCLKKKTHSSHNSDHPPNLDSTVAANINLFAD